MLLTSTYTPSAIADIPVLIVCYGSRKIFMLKTYTFSEMIAHIRQKLVIDPTHYVTLETTALDVCRGCKVEIDEEVWPFMRSSLDEVTVLVSSGMAGSEDIRMLSSESFTTEGLENTPEKRSEPEKEGGVDEWMEEQSQVSQEVYDRPLSACSQNEVSESLLPRDDGDDHPDQNLQGPEYTHAEAQTPVGPIDRPRVRFEAEEPQDIFDPEVFHAAEEDDRLGQRFQVRVAGPEPDQNAEIKTRGKHSVKKVLAAVCKTFGLDYDRAALYIVTYALDDQGHMKAGCRHCPPSWSLAKCGVTSETELVIQLATSEEPTPTVTQKSK